MEPLEEHAEAQYLAQLPHLLADTERQDSKCQQLWNERRQSDYASELEQLLSYFRRFHFLPRVYERLAKQQPKPLVDHALTLWSAGGDRGNEVALLESRIRMALPEFIENEREIARELANLQAVRAQLWTIHETLAIEIATSTPGFDETTLACARFGLRKAADYYDYARVYNFAEYAQHWIREAIERKKSGSQP